MSRKEAVEKLFNETPADYILEEYESPDFFQFVVSCGGDCCTYRIFKSSGMIGEK